MPTPPSRRHAVSAQLSGLLPTQRAAALSAPMLLVAVEQAKLAQVLLYTARCKRASVGSVYQSCFPVRREMLAGDNVPQLKRVNCRTFVLTWSFRRARLTRWDGAAALLRDSTQQCVSAARACVLVRLGSRW